MKSNPQSRMFLWGKGWLFSSCELPQVTKALFHQLWAELDSFAHTSSTPIPEQQLLIHKKNSSLGRTRDDCVSLQDRLLLQKNLAQAGQCGQHPTHTSHANGISAASGWARPEPSASPAVPEEGPGIFFRFKKEVREWTSELLSFLVLPNPVRACLSPCCCSIASSQ